MAPKTVPIPPEHRKAIGDAIINRRAGEGQNSLAARSKVSVSLISRLENGRAEVAQPKKLALLSDALWRQSDVLEGMSRGEPAPDLDSERSDPSEDLTPDERISRLQAAMFRLEDRQRELTEAQTELAQSLLDLAEEVRARRP